MAFSLACPSCSAKLKTATAIPLGRSVQCPKCKASFAVSDENMEEVADAKTGFPAPASKPAPATVSRKVPAEDEEPSKKKRRDDDEENRPRSRKRDDDDDDEENRPRSRKRDDEDEDDKPKSRKRRDDDEENEDDRPRRRGRDDDDVDDRPRSKKKKKKGNKGLMIGLVIGGVLALAGIVYLCISLFGGGDFDSEMMAYMPADTDQLIGVDVEAVMGLSSVKEMFKDGMPGGGKEMETFKKAGLTVDDVSKVLNGDGKAGNTTVVRFKKSLDKGKLSSAFNAKEQKDGDKTYYKAEGQFGMGRFYFLPKDDLVVIADKEDTLKSLLKKEEGKVLVSENLQKLAKRVSGGHFWMAGTGKADALNMPIGGAAANGPADVKDAMKSAKGFAASGKATDSRLDIKLVVLCESSEKASKAAESASKELKDKKGEIDKGVDQMGAMLGGEEGKKALLDLVKSIDISSSGDVVEISANLNYSSFKDKMKKGMPFGK